MFWRKTVRSMRDEFGPLPAERWPELADYTDAELINRPLAEIVAEIEAERAVKAAMAARQTAARTRQKVAA